ncbi:tripartite tricarboxylate transporter substrate binding protein [Variovorax beijingensis]|uniref:Tripartite tricarboxylate transporter substrate binding protein n=1 Tax=Variovorax beijingensis TaxID=2496117 RepID=A0ABY0A165_9BURK|nr:tripartite tricarboxylate transporter substrate binding protein [Variovorax beijingensis]RSZ30809.1 tripartite tricarboxylate transporter substrate binding protein [Variovorax beijingensis]
MIARREILIGGAVALAGLPVQAQPLMTKPVRVVTPFPAGSGPDAALRVVGETLARKWGQPVVVDNRPGGNGFIAITTFKNAPPDHHTLLLIDSNHATTHPHTFARLPYDVEKDLQPVGMILRTPFFVAVAPDSPMRGVEDIVAAAKAKPDAVTYGSWFMGSPGHIGALQLQVLRGIRMTHVPYRDFGQLYAAVATKEVDWALGSIASAGALERAGKLRFIALAAPRRDPSYPNVPATSELSNLREFDVSAWAGLFAARSTPAPVVEQLVADLRDALDRSDVVERYRTFGYEAPRLAPEAYSQLIRRETTAWGQIIRTANLKLD